MPRVLPRAASAAALAAILAIAPAAGAVAVSSISTGERYQSTGGSDAPIPYTVDATGITLPAGYQFDDNDHINVRTNLDPSANLHAINLHLEKLNGQASGQWIGKSHIPWSAFGLSGSFCVEWVQISDINEHFGEGHQDPVCVDPTPTPEPTTEPTTEPTMEPTTEPTVEPTTEPTGEPTVYPQPVPTGDPLPEPTIEPTIEPTGGTGGGSGSDGGATGGSGSSVTDTDPVPVTEVLDDPSPDTVAASEGTDEELAHTGASVTQVVELTLATIFLGAVLLTASFAAHRRTQIVPPEKD